MNESTGRSWLGRQIPEVLRERNFGLYYAGQSLSLLGDAMLPIALVFAVLETTNSASALGLVLAAGIVPQVLFMLAGGVIGDRMDRRLLMILCDLLRFGTQTVQGVLLLTGHANLLTMIVLQVLWGTGVALFKPTATGMIAELVETRKLQQANGLVGLSSNIGYTLGPALGGVLVVASSPGFAILLDGATFLASAVALALLRTPARTRSTVRERSSIYADLVGGWQEFRSRTWLWTLVVWAAGFHLLALPAMQVLGPVVARDELGGASAWATIGVGTGVGLVVGGILALRLKPRYILRATFIPLGFYGLPLLLLAFPVSTALIAVAALLGGIGVSMFNVYFSTAMQQHVPLSALSRVSSYDWLGSIALLPVGQALMGPSAELTSASSVLLVGAAFMLLTPVVLYLIRSARNLPNITSTPEPEPAPAPSTPATTTG